MIHDPLLHRCVTGRLGAPDCCSRFRSDPEHSLDPRCGRRRLLQQVKGERLSPVHTSSRGAKLHIYLLSRLLLVQDVLVVNCSKEFMASNHVLATCRTALKKQGVVGLNMAPCMRAFLERLPVMLQEQYAYEKVHRHIFIIHLHADHILDLVQAPVVV